MSEKIQDPCNATLTDRVDVHESLAIFRVSLDAAPIPDFAPGQFTTLGLADPDAEPRPNSPRIRRTSGTGHTKNAPPSLLDRLTCHRKTLPGILPSPHRGRQADRIAVANEYWQPPVHGPSDQGLIHT